MLCVAPKWTAPRCPTSQRCTRWPRCSKRRSLARASAHLVEAAAVEGCLVPRPRPGGRRVLVQVHDVGRPPPSPCGGPRWPLAASCVQRNSRPQPQVSMAPAVGRRDGCPSSSRSPAARCGTRGFQLTDYSNTIGGDASERYLLVAVVAWVVIAACFLCLRTALLATSRNFDRQRECSPAYFHASSQVNVLSVVCASSGCQSIAECAICLERMDDGSRVARLPCQHCFHEGCIHEWALGAHCTCPTCRHDACSAQR